MKQARRRPFRFRAEDRALLEAAYQKGVESIQKEAEILSKIMGYEEGRIRDWFHDKERRAKHISVENQCSIADKFKKEPKTGYRVASCTNYGYTQTQKLNAKVEDLNPTIQLTNHPFETTRVQRKTLDVDFITENSLMAAYRENGSPSKKSLQQLARYLDIDPGSIKDWFQKVTVSEEVGPLEDFFLDAKQKDILEAAYNSNPYARYEKFLKIKDETNIDIIKIRTWFKRKRRESNLTYSLKPEEERALNEAFQKSKYLSRTERNELADRIGLKPERVRIWFDYEKQKINKKETPNPRKRYKRETYFALNEAYQKNKYANAEEMYELADRFGLEQKQVRKYFENQRSRDTGLNKDSAQRKEQLMALDESYQKNKHPDRDEMNNLACRLGLEYTQIKYWFTNNRRKNNDCRPSTFTPDQKQLLQASYQKNYRPTTKEMQRLAKRIDCTYSKVTGWFSYTRSKNGCPRILPRFTNEQKKFLLIAYKEDKHPNKRRREELAKYLGTTEKRIYFYYVRVRASEESKTTQPKLERESSIKIEDVEVEIKLEHINDMDL